MKSSARSNSLIACFALLLAVSLTGCRTTGFQSAAHADPLPQEELLKERVKEFHGALGDNDVAAWYAMTSPLLRKRMTFDQFKKDVRWKENAANRTSSTMQVQQMRSCNCDKTGESVRCVLAFIITVTESGKKPRIERPLEMWEYSDGQWYWGYIGPDTGGKCPGEK